MPLRTRDFLLYLIAFAFLVIAITVTVIEDVYPKNSDTASVIKASVDAEEVIYTAVVDEKPAIDRAGHLANLRKKIASFKEVITDSVPTPESTPTLVADASAEEPAIVLQAELKCPHYQNNTRVWSPKGLEFSVVEGARILARDVENISLTSSTSSSTPVIELTKEVVLQLPLQTYGASIKSCLPSDVVGIALDGSLIKNSEFGLYSIFGAETLVGYALDGFPIYGQSELKTDECGGIFADSQYRYYLSKERAAVLYCYSGTPVAI